MKTESLITGSPLDLGRMAFAMVKGKGDMVMATAIAKDYGFSGPATILRAAVAAGTTTDADWAASLAEYRNASNGFVQSIRSLSPLDALAPFALNVGSRRRIVIATNALNGSNVAEATNKPVTRLDIDMLDTRIQKAIALVVVTDELLRMSAAQAVPMLQGELGAGVANATNAQFLSDLAAGAATAATFAASPNFLYDLARGVAALGAKGTGSIFAIVPPQVAIDLAADDRSAFDNITPNGGVVRGVTVLVSDRTSDVIFVDARQLSIDAGQVTLASSNAAALQLDDDPTDGSATNLVSMFQTNSVAIRAERFVSYEMLRETASAVATDPDYATGT